MIARCSTVAKFAPLARYLVTGRDGSAPTRVAWTESRNLPSDDPLLAADLMQATAAQNLRVQEPAYHLALSFAPEDHPTPQLLRQVADRVLAVRSSYRSEQVARRGHRGSPISSNEGDLVLALLRSHCGNELLNRQLSLSEKAEILGEGRAGWPKLLNDTFHAQWPRTKWLSGWCGVGLLGSATRNSPEVAQFFSASRCPHRLQITLTSVVNGARETAPQRAPRRENETAPRHVSDVGRSSCPSWARTRTLLIQSQAGIALNSGNLQSNRKFASSAAGVNAVTCRLLLGLTHTETHTRSDPSGYSEGE
jgi:hypothetical protein